MAIVSGSSRFNVIDINQLGRMLVLEDLDKELEIALAMLRFKQIWAEKDPPNAAQYDVENLEFDPIRILQETNVDLRIKLRDRVNQAARAVTLAFAIGTDLDGIASRYPVGPRLPVVENPRPYESNPEDYESDFSYRRRTQLSLNATSPHGPSGAYMFFALTADPALRDASEMAIEGEGEVILTVMADSPPVRFEVEPFNWNYFTDPTPDQDRVLAIRAYVLDAYRKAATDVLTVSTPNIVDTKYRIKVWFYPPPDKNTMMLKLRDKLEALVEDQRWLGHDHTRMAIDAALFQEGVHRTVIEEPAEDIFVNPRGVVRVTDIILEYMGRSE